MGNQRIGTEARLNLTFFIPSVPHLLNFTLKGCCVGLCLNLSREIYFLRLKIGTMGSNGNIILQKVNFKVFNTAIQVASYCLFYASCNFFL